MRSIRCSSILDDAFFALEALELDNLKQQGIDFSNSDDDLETPATSSAKRPPSSASKEELRDDRVSMLSRSAPKSKRVIASAPRARKNFATRKFKFSPNRKAAVKYASDNTERKVFEIAPSDSLMEEAIELHNLEQQSIDFSNSDDDFQTPPTSPAKRPPASTRTELRDDRPSMLNCSAPKSKRVIASAPRSKKNSTTRKLNFSPIRKAAVKYASDNTELSSTDDDERKVFEIAPFDSLIEAPPPPRLSMVTPMSGRVKKKTSKRKPLKSESVFDSVEDSDSNSFSYSILRNSNKKARFSEKKKRKFKSILDDEDSDESFSSVDGNIPYSTLRYRKRKSALAKSNESQLNSSKIINLDGLDSPDRTEIEVKSSLYPLPVVTFSPSSGRTKSILRSSRSKRRSRKILESDEELEPEYRNSSVKKTDKNIITLDSTPSKVIVEPSEEARKILEESKGKPCAISGVEWNQESSIDDFSDSDAPRKRARVVDSPIVTNSAYGVQRHVSDLPNTDSTEPFIFVRSKSLKGHSTSEQRNEVIIIESGSEDGMKEREPIELVVSSVDDLDKIHDLQESEMIRPLPFRLEILCEADESMEDMVRRLGENVVMDKIVEAQNDGRAVIGAEILGISTQPILPSSTVQRLRSAVPFNRKRKRSTYDDEEGFTQEFTFNVRGKNNEKSGRSKEFYKRREKGSGWSIGSRTMLPHHQDRSIWR